MDLESTDGSLRLTSDVSYSSETKSALFDGGTFARHWTFAFSSTGRSVLKMEKR